MGYTAKDEGITILSLSAKIFAGGVTILYRGENFLGYPLVFSKNWNYFFPKAKVWNFFTTTKKINENSIIPKYNCRKFLDNKYGILEMQVSAYFFLAKTSFDFFRKCFSLFKVIFVIFFDFWCFNLTPTIFWNIKPTWSETFSVQPLWIIKLVELSQSWVFWNFSLRYFGFGYFVLPPCSTTYPFCYTQCVFRKKCSA